MKQEDLLDAVAFLQAEVMAATSVLHALIVAHPDPKALLDAWNAVSAQQYASSVIDMRSEDDDVKRFLTARLAQWSTVMRAAAG